MHWQSKSDDISHEEFHLERDNSAFDIRQINLRKDLPKEWSTTRFILLLATSSHDGMGCELPNKEKWENEQPPPSQPDRSRSPRPPMLETIPEGKESEEEEADD